MDFSKRRNGWILALLVALAVLSSVACSAAEPDGTAVDAAAAGVDSASDAVPPTPVSTTEPLATQEPIEAAEPAPTTESLATTEPSPTPVPSPVQSTQENAAPTSVAEPSPTSEAAATETAPAGSSGCAATAAQFATRGSANVDIEDPYVDATCVGDSIIVVSNAVPDFTYIGTSPGVPGGREFTFTIPANPVQAGALTDIPYIGAVAVTLSGIPIYGPTEGTGGDVDSLPGIISACGSHMGPTGFHAHKILSSTETDCFFDPDQVAAAPQLVGYAFDGFPIYTGIDQYRSSWQLTDESLFASDTWAAHSYVEGSGDLDRCNGRSDAAGNYAYYTTAEFPYVLGCFAGQVELAAAGGGGGGDRPEADGEERPERPEGEPEGEAADRPEPPAGEAGERPERPGGQGEGRPERPDAGDSGATP